MIVVLTCNTPGLPFGFDTHNPCDSKVKQPAGWTQEPLNMAGHTIPLRPKDPTGAEDAKSTATGRQNPRPYGHQKTPAGQKMPRAQRGTQEPKTHWATKDLMGAKDAKSAICEGTPEPKTLVAPCSE
eukprot:5221529-Amphidinium_carterae.3